MSESLISSFLVSDVSKLLRSLTKYERCERIAQVAHQKWATKSNSLRSLRGNVRLWANCSGCSPKMSQWVNCSFFWANRPFAHFWAKNERFARKSDERIPSPDNNIAQVNQGFVLPLCMCITKFKIFWSSGINLSMALEWYFTSVYLYSTYIYVNVEGTGILRQEFPRNFFKI